MATPKTKVTITTEDLVSVPQAAKQIGVNFSTVYRWIDKGKIRPFRIGGQVFITVEDLKALKEQRVQEGFSNDKD
jgi:excisionase family DNA binding protein